MNSFVVKERGKPSWATSPQRVTVSVIFRFKKKIKPFESFRAPLSCFRAAVEKKKKKKKKEKERERERERERVVTGAV